MRALAGQRPSALAGSPVVALPRLLARARVDRWAVVALAACLVLALAYVAVVPPFESPDENSHYEYAMRLAELRRAPALEDRSPALYARVSEYMVARGLGLWIPAPDGGRQLGFNQELGRQPPFYYLLPAALGQLVAEPLGLQVRVMRLGSVALGLGVVLLAALAGRAAFPDDPFASRALPLVVGLTPGFLFIAASVNNDNLANLGGALAFLGLVLGVRRGLDRRSALLILGGTALGLAGKRTALALLPTAGIALYVLWAARWRHRTWAIAAIVVPLLALLALPTWALAPTGRVAGWQTTRAGQSSRSEDGLIGSAALLVAADGDAPARLTQVLSAADVTRAGASGLTAAAWIRSADDAPATARIGFDQGLGSSASATLAIDGTWRFARVAFTPSGSGPVRLTLATESRAALFDAVVVAPGDRAGVPELEDARGGTGRWGGERFANLVANGSGEIAERGLRPWVGALADLVGAPAPVLIALGAAQPLPPAALQQRLSFAFEGYLGRFGWLSLPMPDWTYQAATLVGLVAVAGLALRAAHPADRADRPVLGLCVLAALSAVGVAIVPFLIGVMGGELPQGRYLYPSILPLSALIAAGLGRLVPRSRHDLALVALTVGGAALNLVALGVTLVPRYASGA